jgi:succinyl-diaminopimelate desuccinylase
MRDLAATTLELVSVPSVTGQEGELCDHLAAWAAGVAPAERVGHNLILRPPRRPGRALVGLFGHLDTVPPAPGQPVERRGGRVYGCGAADMKAGLALMMAALEERERWSCDLVGVFYEGEEGPHTANGLEKILDRLPALDLAVILEPTANTLEAGCLGGVHARVVFRGRRAHSARPWQGENALYKAVPLLRRLEGWERRPVEVQGLTFYEVMSATTARCHEARNVIPERFELNVNFRYAPGRTAAWARQQVLEMVAGEAEVEWVDEAPPGQVCTGHPLVQAWIERCRLPVRPKQAWTDVARLTGRGIPAVNFGPGDPAQAHQAGEFVAEAALEEGWRLLEGLLAPG